MGFQDRDYSRTAPPSGGLMGGVAPICKWLIATNIAIFLLQIFTRGSSPRAIQGVTAWLELSPDLFLYDFQWWRILTYAFCHSPDTPWHIFFNMLFLWWFGNHLESMYGSREFLRFYLTGALAGGVCHLLLALFLKDHTPMIGASGAVMGVTVVYAMYYPRQVLYVMFVIPIELRWLVLIYVIVDLHPVLLSLSGVPTGDGVAHAAHLGGLLYGFLYKHFDLRYDRLLPNIGWFQFRKLARTTAARRRGQVKLYQPPPEEREAQANLERQVDAILAKISSQGEASLTDAEREVLKEASRRYKRK